MGSVANPTTDAPPEDPMVRWRNYQHLIWSQQQIHLQIQQQQLLQQGQQQPSENKNEGERENSSQPPPPGALHSEKSLEEKTKEMVDPWEQCDAHSAFLGPTLYSKLLQLESVELEDKRLPYDGHDFKLEYVDLEEFLTENGIPIEESTKHIAPPPHGQTNTETPPHGFPPPSQFYAGHGNNGENCSITSDYASSSRSPSPSSSSLSQDMTLDSTSYQTSVPGHEFDPRMRMFSTDELKPQPMIKKSKKQFVPDDAKDAKYWMRRRKNNMAAKRSRDARRVKENQIAMRACYLEKENQYVRQELERMKKENSLLKEQLSHYSTIEQQRR